MPLTDINKAITEAEVIWADQYFAVACKERLLQRIEPWIHRELNAILRDPNPAVLFHLVTPLFISSLEEGRLSPSVTNVYFHWIMKNVILILQSSQASQDGSMQLASLIFNGSNVKKVQLKGKWVELPAINLEDISDARMKKGSKRVERSNGRSLRMSIFIGVNGVDNGLKRIFKNLWILFIKLELILPVVTATVERGYRRMEFVEKELKNIKADQLFIDGLVTYIERDVFFKVSNDDIKKLNVDSLKVDLVVIQNTCSEKEDSNSETASSKSVKESNLNSKTKDVHAIKYKMSKAKERCMTYSLSLNSHIQVLSKEDLKGTRIKHGFKRAFMSLFGQDDDNFMSTTFLNVDQLQKQLDKDDFQEDGSMAAFWVVDNQFQKFIDSQFSLDYYSQMTDKYFVEYTRIEVKHFRDTLLQHMGNVKKFVAERTRHQRQCDRRVNKRQMQTQESKIDTCKAVDADLVVTESSGIESEVQDDSSRSENDTDADDADIRPIYDEEQWLRYN
ncbi:hypothetical protein Tco_0607918 [Tanacetum coccineum]